MKKVLGVIGLAACTVVLSGCGSTFPLVFGDKKTVGFSASVSTDGEINLDLGYKSRNVALVPVAVRDKQSGGCDEATLKTLREDLIKADGALSPELRSCPLAWCKNG